MDISSVKCAYCDYKSAVDDARKEINSLANEAEGFLVQFEYAETMSEVAEIRNDLFVNLAKIRTAIERIADDNS